MASMRTDWDTKLVNSGQLMLRFKSHVGQFGQATDTDTKVFFQLPPKVTSDGKSAQWNENHNPLDEPVAIWASANSRAFTLEWSYVVGLFGWSIKDCKSMTERMRRYFYQIYPNSILSLEYVAHMKLWGFGGKNEMGVRIHSVNISYHKSLIGDFDAEDNYEDGAYPLRTDIKAEMKLWTKAEGAIKAAGLPERVEPGWY